MTSTDAERRPPIVANPSDLVPISQLELDLPAPVTGWLVELDRRHVVVLRDDIGRDSITRADARELIHEHRENEARKIRMQQQIDRQAIAADQEWRASLNPGIPWYNIGRDISPAAALLEAQRDAEYAGRPRSAQTELLEAELGGKGGTMVYHSLADEEDTAS